MDMPDWDVFATYRTFGGWDQMTPFILVVETEGGPHLVKSEQKYAEGEKVCYRLTSQGYWVRGDNTLLRSTHADAAMERGTVARVFSKEDFSEFNFDQATALEVSTIGEFMCGVPLHGQWLGELFQQMRCVVQGVRAVETRNEFLASRILPD